MLTVEDFEGLGREPLAARDSIQVRFLRWRSGTSDDIPAVRSRISIGRPSGTDSRLELFRVCYRIGRWWLWLGVDGAQSHLLRLGVVLRRFGGRTMAKLRIAGIESG